MAGAAAATADAGAGGSAAPTETADTGGAAGDGATDQSGSGGQAGADSGTAGEHTGGVGGEPGFVSSSLPYATSVESFTPGEDAGFNQTKLPGIALGPPHGLGTGQGSLDVVSLGAGGEIVLGFGEQRMVDGPGPDLIVFENPFWPNGDASQVFAELGEVSVSEDGQSWHAFPCDTAGDGQGHYAGCAGVTPTLKYDPLEVLPLDAAKTGGDAFDLADLNLSSARFVKIRDLRTLPPAGTSSGFDLDAVGLVHVEAP